MNTSKIYQTVRWLLTACLLLTLTLAGPVSVARAASYAVSNLNDSGAGSLRQAILDADATAGNDTITFSVSGTILLSSTLPDITDTAGLTIDGAGQSITLSGNDAVRVMVVNGGALALHNLMVTRGYNNSGGGGIVNVGTLSVTDSTFSANDGGEGFGGGILNYGTLHVTDSTFSGNSAAVGGGIANLLATATVTNSTFSGNSGVGGDGGFGGGIANYGTLTVTGSTFSGNSAIGYITFPVSGGGIYNAGALDISDCTFSGNTVSYGSGGGIYNRGTLSVTNATFSGNSGDQGGGIYNDAPSGALTVNNSTFSGNSAQAGGYAGGGIYNAGTLSVTDSTFSGNSTGGPSYGYGGGIYNSGTLDVTGSTFSGNRSIAGGFGGSWDGGGIYNTGRLSVTDSTFSGNSAGGGVEGDGAGGGIRNYGTLSVTDSTFSGNSAGTYGGGIDNEGTGIVTNSTFSGNTAENTGGGIEIDGTLTVTNSTFSGNYAPSGGGIGNFGTLTLQNSIVANSTGGGNCVNYGSLTDGGGNLSWPDTTCPGLNADPLLGPLQDNSGPTQTQALLPGSPAIDAALLANCPATDQRGVSRPQGPGCDIGAFELEFVYNFSGFFQPVDNLPTLNIVRAGAAVPVKFSLGGDQGLDIFAAGYPISKRIACESGAPQDDIERAVTAGSSSLSYNAGSDIYTYVWKTNPAWAGTCRQLIVKLNDGSVHKANFRFGR